jgi:microcompartment protein CcmL/EutN
MPSASYDAGHPALGLLEVGSLARALTTVDALLKRAHVQLVMHRPVSPGKQLILFRGEVAAVEESFAVGVETAGAALVDSLLLPGAHDSLWAHLGGHPPAIRLRGALCVVECTTVVAALLGADAAAKAADVTLTELRLGAGIGGKGAFAFTGSLDSAEAAADAARTIIAADRLIELELVAQPHDDLAATRLLG